MRLSAEGNGRQRTMLWAAVALAAGLMLRAAFVWNHARFAGDTLTYGDLAHNMLAHHIFGFTENRVRPTLIRLPGYPLFLAACFEVFGTANYLAVLWVQVVIDLVSCALLGLTAGRLMGRRAGFATLWLAALCPFTANYAAAALTETLSIFCVALAFFALERWLAGWRDGRNGRGWAVVVGIALAYAVLLRPDQGLLAAAVVPAMVWVGLCGMVGGGVSVAPHLRSEMWGTQRLRERLMRLRPALIVCVVVALPLLGWAGRNWRTFHVIQPLAPRYANDPGEPISFGFQRWYRTWAIDFKATLDVYWKYDGDVIRMDDLPRRAFDSAKQWQETNNLIAAYNQQTSASPAFDREFDRIAAQRIKASPLRYYVLLPLARDLNMWLRPRTEFFKLPVDWWQVRLHPKRSALVIAYGLWNAAYLALAAGGLWVWFRRGWSGQAALAAAMIGFVALRFALLLTLDNSEPRYTLECYPVVFLLAGIALASWSGFRAASSRGGSAARR